MEVSKACGVSGGTGSVAELHVGIICGNLSEEGFVTEAVGKDNVATCVHEFFGGGGASLVLENVGFDDDIAFAQSEFAYGESGGVDEVLVIGRFFTVQADETEFEIRRKFYRRIISILQIFISG